MDSNQTLLEVRTARASSVIIQRIPPERVEVFLEWQRGVTAVAAKFPGYQTTEVYPPAEAREQEWVVVVHFHDAKTLQDWLDSPQRAEWTAKLPAGIGDFQLKTWPSGFKPWFVGSAGDGAPLPHWKMFLTVLFALYPIVMIWTFCVGPHTQRFGLAVAMLIGNAASVSLLEWFVMPVLSRLFGPWLHARGKEGQALTRNGLFLVLGALGLMTFLFSLLQ